LLAPQAASSALAPLQCREIGAYGDEAALQAAEAALLGHMKLAGGQWQRVDRSIAGQWLLASRAADNAADLERKKQALQRAGVEPLRAQSIKGESEPSWIVQRFDDESGGPGRPEPAARQGPAPGPPGGHAPARPADLAAPACPAPGPAAAEPSGLAGRAAALCRRDGARGTRGGCCFGRIDGALSGPRIGRARKAAAAREKARVAAGLGLVAGAVRLQG
jgi:hypothetical protein